MHVSRLFLILKFLPEKISNTYTRTVSEAGKRVKTDCERKNLQFGEHSVNAVYDNPYYSILMFINVIINVHCVMYGSIGHSR